MSTGLAVLQVLQDTRLGRMLFLPYSIPAAGRMVQPVEFAVCEARQTGPGCQDLAGRLAYDSFGREPAEKKMAAC